MKKIWKVLINISSLVLMNIVFLEADALPKGVSIHILDNGLQVVLIENPALPMVGVNTVVKVGSAFETFATSGMSHMLEHLLFNGTTSRTQKQLYDDTDRIGGYNNANTSEYFTNYMMVTPVENILKGMEVQADMLFNSVLPEENFRKEKGIVLEEISKSLSNSGEQINRNLISILYNGHALSLPTLGTYATIEAMQRDAVFRFYKDNYVPNNMILSAIGNFNSLEMLNNINDIYGKYHPNAVVHSTTENWSSGFDPESLIQPSQNSVYHRFYSGEELQLQLLYQIPVDHNSAFYALLDKKLEDDDKKIEEVLNQVFGEKVKTVSMQTIQTPLSAYLEVTLIIAESEDAAHITSTVNRYIKNSQWAISQDRLAAEANKARTDFLKNIEKPHMFGIYNAHRFAVNGIEAVLASYSSDKYYQAAPDLQNLNIDADPVIIIQHPQKEGTDKSESSKIVERSIESDGSAPALIIKQNADSELLAIHYLIGHKASLEAEFGKDAAKILHACFGERMKSNENSQISSRFGLSLTVNDNEYIPMDDIYLNPDFGYIRVEALSDDITSVIDFFSSELQSFIPSKDEYQTAVKKFGRSMPMMMGRKDPVEEYFKESYQEIIYEENIYTVQQEFPTYEELIKFRGKYFYPGNMVISIVSSADPETISRAFVGFSGSDRIQFKPIYSKKLKLQAEEHNVYEEGGGNRSYLFWGFSTPIDEIDQPALQALSLILNEKIVFDIREVKGMAYHMKAGIEVIEDRALFYINQGTMPQNVDHLLKQYPKYFNKSNLNDISTESLEKSINMYLGRIMFRRLSSINQAYYLSHSYYFQKNINFDETFLDDLKKVTINDVIRVADKYMNVRKPISIVIK